MLRLAAAFLLLTSPAAADVRFFPTPAAPLTEALSTSQPRVLAFGEYHEIKGAAKVPSALRHFIDELLPVVAPRASDLVVETWVTAGSCGRNERSVTAQVEKTTQRPESTEDEVVTLLKRGKEAGLKPHILTVSCAEYKKLLDDKGEIDLVRLLGTVTKLLRKETERALPRARAVVIYGGALHNDVEPRAELRGFSFARELTRAARGRYLEIDLYVREFVENDKDITGQPWWPAVAAGPPGQTALVTRGPRSITVVFPRAR